ncbi:hypothetical protein BC834DRAFT_163934 [Gloeopeniophorella convolvens]|nr:hypothetical protein BC834DRAFT_163934 [Gloeopeniophorella convolvens]
MTFAGRLNGHIIAIVLSQVHPGASGTGVPLWVSVGPIEGWSMILTCTMASAVVLNLLTERGWVAIGLPRWICVATAVLAIEGTACCIDEVKFVLPEQTHPATVPSQRVRTRRI